MNYKIFESKKIAIFGWPATGKSTFGEFLSDKLGIELYSLDIIRFKYSTDGIKDDNKFLDDYKQLLKKDKWIIEGNALDFIDSRLKQADLLFFFDSTVEECIKNYNNRENKINAKKEERKGFDVEKSIDNMEGWIKNRYSKKIDKLRSMLNNYKSKLIIINSYKELDELMIYINENFHN